MLKFQFTKEINPCLSAVAHVALTSQYNSWEKDGEWEEKNDAFATKRSISFSSLPTII